MASRSTVLISSTCHSALAPSHQPHDIVQEAVIKTIPKKKKCKKAKWLSEEALQIAVNTLAQTHRGGPQTTSTRLYAGGELQGSTLTTLGKEQVHRELPRVPLRGEGSCRGGGDPRESAGSGATEEGLISRGHFMYC